MSGEPLFTVVIAAYNRSHHILPTIRSALAQLETDFEIRVVGDGCTDDTGAVVQSLRSPRVFWSNLSQTCGSQSFPNNEGIRIARGKWIAYLGHDDIWAPDHLAALRHLIETNGDLDFAVSGCAFWAPPGAGVSFVTGIFDAPDDLLHRFAPPSSLAHRRDVTERIGPWGAPESLTLPVDSEFEVRAGKAGMTFASTGRVTVHKFAAGQRYLSYLQPASAEQEATLAAMAEGTAPKSEAIVEAARARNRLAGLPHPPPAEPGGYFRLNRVNKGLTLPPLRPLLSPEVMEIEPGTHRALDWSYDEAAHAWVSGENPRPRWPIPFTGYDAEFEIELKETPAAKLPEKVALLVNERAVGANVVNMGEARARLLFRAPLRKNGYSVIQFLLLPQPESFAPSPAIAPFDRLAIGAIRVTPVPLSSLEKFRRDIASAWHEWRPAISGTARR